MHFLMFLFLTNTPLPSSKLSMPEPSVYLFILGQSVVPIVLILFFFKRDKSRADHLFMAWMALSIFSSGLFLWQRWQGPGVSHPSQTIRAEQVLATLDIVFLYFYCSHLLSRNYKTRKVDFLTLLPFGIAVLLWISHLFGPGIFPRSTRSTLALHPFICSF